MTSFSGKGAEGGEGEGGRGVGKVPSGGVQESKHTKDE